MVLASHGVSACFIHPPKALFPMRQHKHGDNAGTTIQAKTNLAMKKLVFMTDTPPPASLKNFPGRWRASTRSNVLLGLTRNSDS